MKKHDNIMVNVLRPETNQIILDEHKKSMVCFRLEGIRDGDDLTLDLYPVENQSHPNRHHGYWVYHAPADAGYSLHLDFQPFDSKSLCLQRDDSVIPPSSVWINRETALEPMADLQIVVRRGGTIRRLVHLTLQLRSQKEIELFYRREEGGIYHLDAFNTQFHHSRLRLLHKLFRRTLRPGNTILDAASGQGIFSLLDNPYGVSVFCTDIRFRGFTPVQGRKQIYYIQGKIHHLPYSDGSFDLIFAGEALEHFSDPDGILSSFHRLLKPHGRLIVTTPNARRLINRIRRFALPLSCEHISERSLEEWSSALEKAGFQVQRKSAIYLELFLSYWKKGEVSDWLRRNCHRRWTMPLIRVLMRLGGIFPSAAFDLVLLAKKK